MWKALPMDKDFCCLSALLLIAFHRGVKAKNMGANESRPKDQRGSPNDLKFEGHRSPVLGTRAAVATSQPLASDVGLRILRSGGNAVDAAVAIAAALNVTEPCSTGLGGDCFMLYFEASTRKVHAMNGSGAAPAGLTLERCKADLSAAATATTVAREKPASPPAPAPCPVHIPHPHPHSVTVPGTAAGWVDAVNKFGSGKLSLSQILEPAVQLADTGFPVSPITAHHWAELRYQLDNGPWGGDLLMPGGTAPAPGEVFRNPALAGVLRELGRGGKRAFYEGRIGRAIVEAIQSKGGLMTMEDLKKHRTTFVEPIVAEFCGVRVHEVPPNGQGITALLALNMLKHLDVPGLTPRGGGESTAREEENEVPYLHRLIEVMRLAFADARWYCADMDKVHVPVEALLSDSYAKERAGLFNPSRASVDVSKGSPPEGSCTVSFQVVDQAGNAVSFVNSNYSGFGTGIVPRSCGFSLQSRGANFSLDPSHPNVIAPGKRPYHTIIPCMVTHAESGELYATLSNMGKFMQPQGHVQLLMNLLVRGMDPQAAVDSPRFCIRSAESGKGSQVAVEPGAPEQAAKELRALGHDVVVVQGHNRSEFGRAQIIVSRVSNGIKVLWAGSDGRGDGCAMAW